MRSARCCTSVESSLRERRCTSPLKGVFGDSVGGPHPPLLSPGMGIHPLFGPRALAVAPPHERYQRADHPLVSGITTLQIQGDPQAGDADDCGRLPLQKWGGCRPEGFPA